MPTVLVADDQPDLLEILRARFTALGFTVLAAADGEEALRLIRESRPDVAVLDVMMPERNGYQVCREVKADPTLAATPVILLTVKDSDADRFWGAEVGADLYLTKPMDPKRVVAHAQALVGAGPEHREAPERGEAPEDRGSEGGDPPPAS